MLAAGTVDQPTYNAASHVVNHAHNLDFYPRNDFEVTAQVNSSSSDWATVVAATQQLDVELKGGDGRPRDSNPGIAFEQIMPSPLAAMSPTPTTTSANPVTGINTWGTLSSSDIMMNPINSVQPTSPPNMLPTTLPPGNGIDSPLSNNPTFFPNTTGPPNLTGTDFVQSTFNMGDSLNQRLPSGINTTPGTDIFQAGLNGGNPFGPADQQQGLNHNIYSPMMQPPPQSNTILQPPSTPGAPPLDLMQQPQTPNRQPQLSQPLSPTMNGMNMAHSMGLQRDNEWLKIEVCRDWQRGVCKRDEGQCRFACRIDPTKGKSVENGKVVCCYDFLKGRCKRESCKYFHPPPHLKQQIEINGRNNLLKNRYTEQPNIFLNQRPQNYNGNQRNYSSGSGEFRAMPPPNQPRPLLQEPRRQQPIPNFGNLSINDQPFNPNRPLPGGGPQGPGVLGQRPQQPFMGDMSQTAQQTLAVVKRPDRLECCRDHLRKNCHRGDQECKYAHPRDTSMIDPNDNTVIVCMDSVKKRCQREHCKYFHPPPHLQTKVKMMQQQHQQSTQQLNLTTQLQNPSMPFINQNLGGPPMLIQQNQNPVNQFQGMFPPNNPNTQPVAPGPPNLPSNSMNQMPRFPNTPVGNYNNTGPVQMQPQNALNPMHAPPQQPGPPQQGHYNTNNRGPMNMHSFM